MSSGTYIIQQALSKISAHSVLSPANPESIQTGKEVLNGMIAEWNDKGIITGAVPLSEPGSELSEPLGARNGIIDNLSILMSPYFPAVQPSALLVTNAKKGMNEIRLRWKDITIPKPQTRETLPLGQGNDDNFIQESPFFDSGAEIG